MQDLGLDIHGGQWAVPKLQSLIMWIRPPPHRATSAYPGLLARLLRPGSMGRQWAGMPSGSQVASFGQFGGPQEWAHM